MDDKIPEYKTRGEWLDGIDVLLGELVRIDRKLSENRTDLDENMKTLDQDRSRAVIALVGIGLTALVDLAFNTGQIAANLERLNDDLEGCSCDEENSTH